MEFLAKKSEEGFTLIELLVVIAIIGILTGIVLVSLGGARSQARDARRMSDIRQVVSAQEMYYGDSYSYLTAPGQNGIPAIGTYLPAIDDPMEPTSHYIWVENDDSTIATGCTVGEFFCVYATLEKTSTTAGNTIYFASSEKGTTKLDQVNPPDYAIGDCDCW